MGNNMTFYCCLREIFLHLAGIFLLFTLCLDVWQKKWKRLCFDIFVCVMPMPLWIILGIAILRFFPDLIYSYFSGIWMVAGVVLWISPHSIMTVKAIKIKDRLDIAHSIAVLLAIILFCVSICLEHRYPSH